MPEIQSLQSEKIEAASRNASTPTTRRNAKMRLLLAELAVRELNHAAVASLLQCSMATARIYMDDLLEAALVAALPIEQRQVCANRASYRIVAEQRAIKAFLDDLLAKEIDWSPGAQQRNLCGAGRHLHTHCADLKSLARFSQRAVQRDPLVAALFGEGNSDRYLR